ncbi:DUF5333 family protein [Tateyamaria sp. SN6-1]|uniref:DUF5333 family protein n=1 Tax=Tateyamaria sp. SN6-1 TaxID=3092148 RepID=UPI0039F5924C
MIQLVKLSIVGVLLTLCACAEGVTPESTGTPEQVIDPALAERVYVESLPVLLAEQVAKRCGSIRLKQGARSGEEQRIVAIAEANGVSRAQLDRAFRRLNKRRVQEDGLAFIAEYDIVVAETASWCEAGQTMIQRNDKYGRFLVSL